MDLTVQFTYNQSAKFKQARPQYSMNALVLVSVTLRACVLVYQVCTVDIPYAIIYRVRVDNIHHGQC